MIRSKNYILDFTHVYIDEDIQQESGISLIDCSDIEGCDLYCSKAAEIEIKKRTEQYGIHGIHFIDSGNFHYITKINIDRIMKPFSLVLYDHHTDMQEPMTAEHWAGMADRAAEWFKKVDAGEIENPFDPKKPVKPYRPAPSKKLSK